MFCVNGLRRNLQSRSRPSGVWGQTAGRGLAPRRSLTAASGWPHRAGSVCAAARPVARLSSLAFAPQLLHVGADCGEVVGSAGSVHGVSSHLGYWSRSGYRMRATVRYFVNAREESSSSRLWRFAKSAARRAPGSADGVDRLRPACGAAHGCRVDADA